MSFWLAVLGAVALGPGAPTAADAVTLRDGKVLLGQVLEANARGRTIVAARRAWVAANLPDHVDAWQKAEDAWRLRARSQRSARLDAWARERAAAAAVGDDPIGAWIDRERKRLAGSPEDDLPPLMVVSLRRNEIRSVDRKPPDLARRLRQGWRAGFDGIEGMPPDRLESALQAKGFAMSDVDPASIEDLLPIPPEPDEFWLSRRAATEILHEDGLRFIQHGGLVLPEGAAGGQRDQAAMAGAAAEALRGLLGDGPAEDPLQGRLAAVEARGRVGAVVTQLQLAPDLGGATVTATLLVRVAPGRWVPASRRSATARAGEVPENEAAPLAADPQVDAAFKLLDGLGLGITPAMKARSLAVGAATRRALGQARQALDADLKAAALPIEASAPSPAEDEQAP